MAQDPQVEIKRAQLKKEKETLAKAQERLDRLTEDSPDVDVDQDAFVTVKGKGKAATAEDYIEDVD